MAGFDFATADLWFGESCADGEAMPDTVSGVPDSIRFVDGHVGPIWPRFAARWLGGHADVGLDADINILVRSDRQGRL